MSKGNIKPIRNFSGYAKKLFSAGDLVFREGDLGDEAYIIEKGRVEIFVGEEDAPTPVAVLGVGEIFGEMAIVDFATRAASARVLEDCELTVVSQEQLSERIDTADPIVRLLISMLIKRNRENLHKKSNKLGNVALMETAISEIITELEQKEIDDVGALDKIKMESELQSALEQEDFELFYQPILDSKSRKIAGFEALIRWDHPKRGMVRPDIFMGIAEETSLIIPIGQWVIEQACRDTKYIRSKIKSFNNIKKNFFMAVNVSGRQLNDPVFFDVLEHATRENHIMPSNFKLEITERVLVGGNLVEQWITECHKRGFTVALDDFGTGYSSLSYLSQFAVDNLKIDRSFVRKIHDDKKSKVIVKAIIDLAKGLGIRLVAEGIETERDAVTLRKMGCDYQQGYLYTRPLSLPELLKFLEEQYQVAI